MNDGKSQISIERRLERHLRGSLVYRLARTVARTLALRPWHRASVNSVIMRVIIFSAMNKLNVRRAGAIGMQTNSIRPARRSLQTR